MNEREHRIAAQREPITLELEPGTYWWCACGRSADQPWCDGSHKGLEVKFRPVRVDIDKPGTYTLCACKQTASEPFCDGTHATL